MARPWTRGKWPEFPTTRGGLVDITRTRTELKRVRSCCGKLCPDHTALRPSCKHIGGQGQHTQPRAPFDYCIHPVPKQKKNFPARGKECVAKNEPTNERRNGVPSTSYKECCSLTGKIWSLYRQKNPSVLAGLIHSVQRRRGHARRSVLRRRRGAEVDGREHAGWPLHGLYGQQLRRVSDDIGPSVMGLRPGSNVCSPVTVRFRSDFSVQETFQGIDRRNKKSYS